MKGLHRILLVVAALVIVYFAWPYIFPNPRQAVINRINKLARLASFSPGDGNLVRIANIQKLGQLFSEDVQVVVNIPGYDPQSFNRREELMQAAMATRNYANGLKVEFLDLNIELGAGNESALVDLTLKAKPGGDTDIIAQELKFTLKKIKGDWLITRIETVDTLKP